jgi:hypothetical protein
MTCPIFAAKMFQDYFLASGEINKQKFWVIFEPPLYNLYSSRDIIWMMKSRGMRWEGHVANLGEVRKAYKILVGKPEGRRETAWMT